MREPAIYRMVRHVIRAGSDLAALLQLFPAAMRIRVNDPKELSDLLSFLRGAGAIAFRCDGETLDVQLPGSANERAEQTEIGAFLTRWQEARPDVVVRKVEMIEVRLNVPPFAVRTRASALPHR